MKGICLRFYTYENQKHDGLPLFEWLLEFAKANNIHGGSAFRGIAGFGRHGDLHENHFFELTPNVPIELVFIMPAHKADLFLEALRPTALDLFYVKTEIEYGTSNRS